MYTNTLGQNHGSLWTADSVNEMVVLVCYHLDDAAWTHLVSVVHQSTVLSLDSSHSWLPIRSIALLAVT